MISVYSFVRRVSYSDACVEVVDCAILRSNKNTAEETVRVFVYKFALRTCLSTAFSAENICCGNA